MLLDIASKKKSPFNIIDQRDNKVYNNWIFMNIDKKLSIFNKHRIYLLKNFKVHARWYIYIK